MTDQDRTPPTNDSHAGDGAGDQDRRYEFGRNPSSAQPAPFTQAEFARLLMMRGRVRRVKEHFASWQDE